MWFKFRVLLVVLLLAGFALPGVSRSFAQDIPAGDEQRIARHIKDLGGEEFATRENAQRELLKIGDPAEAALIAAAALKDIEVSRRATAILLELARRRIPAEIEKITWAKVLDRVRQHAANKDWQADGFTDEVLEGALLRLVNQANAALGEPRVKLPTTFAECRVARGRELGRPEPNKLYVAQGLLNVGHAQQSIILVDGNVNVSYATNCIIVARGVVTVEQSEGNLILAGQHLAVSSDGTRNRGERDRERDRSTPAGQKSGDSLLMSGGDLRGNHSFYAVCYAHGKVEFREREKYISLIPKENPVLRREGSNLVEAKLLFTPAAAPNSLEGKLNVVQAYPLGKQHLLILEKDDVEYVLRSGEEIKDNLGQPIPELAGWKLSYVKGSVAVFSNGKEDACIQVPRY